MHMVELNLVKESYIKKCMKFKKKGENKIMRKAFGLISVLVFSAIVLSGCFVNSTTKTTTIPTTTTTSLGVALSSVSDLAQLNGSSSRYYLANDINLSSVQDWTPISNFSGVLNGMGFSISGLSITSNDDNKGFFSTLNGTVINLSFTDVNISLSGMYEKIGVVAGTNAGTINDVNVSGSVSTPMCSQVGGIAGSNQGSIIGSTNRAQISGINMVGGIVGYSSVIVSTRFSNNVNSGNITGGNDYTGGIAGKVEVITKTYSDAYQLAFDNNSNEGEVISEGDNVGGVFGYISGNTVYSSIHGIDITNSSNSGNVLGTNYVGGIAGNANEYVFEVSGCGNSGDITGENYVGGYIGYAKDAMIYYATNNNEIHGNAYVGGIAGYVAEVRSSANTGSITSTSSITVNQIQASYVGGIAGLAFRISDCTNSVDISVISGGAFVGGIVGYLSIVSTGFLEDNENTGNISSTGSYVGGIVGMGKVITSSYSDEYLLGFDNNINQGNISGDGDYVGGVFGYISGNTVYSTHHGIEITNSSNSGIITGSSYTGGIAGSAYEDVYDIVSCTNTGDITGDNYVGGYVGYSADGIVSYASNNNHITGNAFVGGIAGYLSSANNCTNSGTLTSNSAITQDELLVAYVGGIAGRALNVSGSTNNADISVNTGGAFVAGLIGYVPITSETVIEDNTNNGDIVSNGHYTGGIVGKAEVVTSSYSDAYVIEFSGNENGGSVTSVGSYIGGLFGFLSGNKVYSTEHVVVVSNSSNTGSVTGSNYVGGIVGSGYAQTRLNSLTNEANITGLSYLGGIAGYSSEISYSTNRGEIYTDIDGAEYTTNIYVGGIAGYSDTVYNNTNYGHVFSDSTGLYVGGISGYSKPGNLHDNLNEGIVESYGGFVGGVTGFVELYSVVNIQNNTNSASVSGYSIVGGLFGSINISVSTSANTSTLLNNLNTGSVTGEHKCTGGITGLVFGASNKYVQYNNCSNTGTITGESFVGGIVGANIYNTYKPSSSNCVSTGSVVATDGLTSGMYYATEDPNAIIN